MDSSGKTLSTTNGRASRPNCLGIVILAAGVTVLNGGALALEAQCERETISTVVSPDNTWVALVQEGLCTGGSITVSTDTVQLARRNLTDTIQLAQRPEAPQHENDILVVDYYGHAENRPVTRWLSPEKLQITIPNISAIGLHKSNYQGVEIVIKYEPDDPAARERWRKERGLAPE
jgi:hypothetical protein